MLILGSTVVAGMTYMLMLAEPLLLPLLALWFASGLAWAVFWLTGESVWAQLIPDSLRGRVYSLADATVHLAEAGMVLLGGWLVSLLGPVQALFVIGLSISVGSVLLSVASKGFKALGKLSDSDWAVEMD
jgi:hypothetical protein